MDVNNININNFGSGMVSQTTLFKMGFNKKMVDTLLLNPVLCPNPYGKGSAPRKLFPANIVDAVLKTEEFASLRAERKQRGVTQRNAAQEREQELVEQAKRIAGNLIIPAIDKEELLAAALECQADHFEQKYYTGISDSDGDCWWRDDDDIARYIKTTATSSDKAEWMLDYLLLVYTDLPQVEARFNKEKNGKRAVCIIKHLYYRAAARSNPYLSKACKLRSMSLFLEKGYHPEDFTEED